MLVTRVLLVNHVKLPFAAHDFAIGASFLDRCSNFHNYGCLVQKLIVKPWEGLNGFGRIVVIVIMHQGFALFLLQVRTCRSAASGEINC